MAPRLAALARDGKIGGAAHAVPKSRTRTEAGQCGSSSVPRLSSASFSRPLIAAMPNPFSPARVPGRAAHLPARSTVSESLRSGRAPGCSPGARRRRFSRAHTGRRRDLRSTGWVMGLRNRENLAPALALAVMPPADGLPPTGSAEATREQHETGLSEGRKGSGPSSFVGCRPGSQRS